MSLHLTDAKLAIEELVRNDKLSKNKRLEQLYELNRYLDTIIIMTKLFVDEDERKLRAVETVIDGHRTDDAGIGDDEDDCSDTWTSDGMKLSWGGEPAGVTFRFKEPHDFVVVRDLIEKVFLLHSTIPHEDTTGRIQFVTVTNRAVLISFIRRVLSVFPAVPCKFTLGADGERVIRIRETLGSDVSERLRMHKLSPSDLRIWTGDHDKLREFRWGGPLHTEADVAKLMTALLPILEWN